MVPLVRMHAFEARLKRMLKSLDTDGMFDPETGLLTRDSFWRDLTKAVAEAADRSQALSVARYSFDGALDRARQPRRRPAGDAARSAISISPAATTTARSWSPSRRPICAARMWWPAASPPRSRTAMFTPHAPHDKVTANVTLATLKTGDTLDSLMQRVMGSRMVAAE